jgi:hypothetical protein
MIAGYGLANLGYLLFVAGVWPGSFRILGLKKRWQVLVSAALSLAAGIGLFTFASQQPRQRATGSLDPAVRGGISTEAWNALPAKFKHLQCLEYKISSMAKLVSAVSGPVDLLQHYPSWSDGLAECQLQYPIDKKRAEQMREAIATQMEAALGKETSMFLTLQRLNGSRPDKNWLEEWRAFAIVGVDSVSEALTKEPYTRNE